MFNALQQSAHPALQQHAQAQTGTLLNIRLDVGRKEESRMNINGLVIELHEDSVTGKYPPLPGANGPNPRLSTGAKSLVVKEDAYFVDTFGKQLFPLLNGCWEMVWRDGAKAGSIVCGFDVPKEARRNEASLPAGRLYMSFPVWTKEGLAEAQAYKRQVEEMARKHEQDKIDELAKVGETSNILMKALHYRNAVAANEKYGLSGISQVAQIPPDTDTMAIQDDLLLTTKGTVWMKDSALFGSVHGLLGTATVSPVAIRGAATP